MKKEEFNPVLFEEAYEALLGRYANFSQPCPTKPRPKTSAQKAANNAGQVQSKAPKPPAPVNRTPNKPKPKKRKCPSQGALQFDEVNELKERLKKTDGSYDAIDKEMKALAKERGISTKELHNQFKTQEGMIPDEWASNFAEVYDFTRCQRSDGTFYGTGGVCRSGVEVGPREMKALKKAAANGNERAAAALAVVEGKKSPEEAKADLGKAAPKEAAKKEVKSKPEEKAPAPKEAAPKEAAKKVDPNARPKEAVQKDLDATRAEMAQVKEKRAKALEEGYESRADNLLDRQYELRSKVQKLEAELEVAPDKAAPIKKGELAPDKDAWRNSERLESAASSWRQRQGLDDVTHEHDLIHVGTHSFLGRSSEDLARIQGTKGVTPSEEILVNLVSQHAMGGGGPIDVRSVLLQDARDMKDFFAADIGVTPAMLDRWDRSASTAVKIFERMSKQPGFDEFIAEMERYSA